MFGRRKLTFALAAMGAAMMVMGLGSIPVASAEPCVVTITVAGGQTLTFPVDVPPGTSVSPSSLTSLPVESASQTCQSSSSSSTSTGTSSSSSTSSTSSSTTSSTPHSHVPPTPTATPQPSSHTGAAKPAQKPAGGKGKSSGNATGNSTSTQTASVPKAVPPSPGSSPTASFPAFSFAFPGPAPIGVPNFFIDSFRIPPFLLPIYQAAGIQYDVPWQVLAAINEIETDYGRNLSVSSAGAVGWMQFLPSTWKQWGVDANGDGIADPYNPVDAIFAAARYLQAAGSAKSVPNAIYAYNHAGWYVQSVLLRAKLIGGMPDQLIGALTGLVEGHFPVAAPAKYADDNVQQLATRPVHGANASIPIASTPSKAVSIFAKQGSPVIAVNDGKIVNVGDSSQLGKFVQLQDQTGNIYTFAHLGSVPREYPVPKPVRLSPAQLAQQLAAPLPSPRQPASAGQQQSAPTVSTATATKEAQSNVGLPQTTSTASAGAPPAVASMVKERLFAYPSRPASYAAGGDLQLQNTQAEISNFHNYFSDVLHLARDQYTLAPLKAGAIVVAGTILGRLAPGDAKQASHMQFMVQPAGKKAPQIDPKPILDGWKLLEATAVYRASGINPFVGPGAKNATIGQILLMSKEQLQNRILQDPHVQIYPCGRRDIQAGLVDRRVLATLEFLSASGLQPAVSGLICGNDAADASGSSVEISKVNNTPILGHQGTGSVTDLTIRRLLTLQGAMKPDQIISQMSFKGQSNTLALPDHKNRIQVTFTPLFGTNKKLSAEIKTILQPGQWIQLINRISQIPEPVVPITPSKYAVRTAAP